MTVEIEDTIVAMGVMTEEATTMALVVETGTMSHTTENVIGTTVALVKMTTTTLLVGETTTGVTETGMEVASLLVGMTTMAHLRETSLEEATVVLLPTSRATTDAVQGQAPRIETAEEGMMTTADPPQAGEELPDTKLMKQCNGVVLTFFEYGDKHY